MLASSFLSLLLLLNRVNRVSSAPMQTCSDQRPCFRTEFEHFGPGQDDEDHDNTMHICMVVDRSDPLCTKEDAISYACVGEQRPAKRSGLGATNEETSDECNDAASTICYYNAPCFDPNGDPIPAADRFVEFDFKDGQGCGVQDGPDCRFVDPDDPTPDCCAYLGDDEASGRSACGPDEKPCCRGHPEGNWCTGPDPEYQISCEPASEQHPVCDGKNYKGCVHKVYYECPEVDCETDHPSSSPTKVPTPPTPQPTGNGQCLRQNGCIDVRVDVGPRSDPDEAVLTFAYDPTQGGCEKDATDTLSHVCVPNEAPGTELDFECVDVGDVNCDDIFTGNGDGVYEAAECADCKDSKGEAALEFKPGNGDGPIIKIAEFPGDGGFTLTGSCTDPIEEQHFHFSIKDQSECLDAAVFSEGNLLCVSGVEANYCDDRGNKPESRGKDCFYSYWFCKECPLYKAGDEDFKMRCDLAIDEDPHPAHPHTLAPGGAAMNNEENEDNVFGLKNASKSETAGLMSVIVIIVSIVSVVGTVVIYKYVTKNKGVAVKEMLSAEDHISIPPVSPISMESNGSGQSAEVVTNDGVIIEA